MNLVSPGDFLTSVTEGVESHSITLSLDPDIVENVANLNELPAQQIRQAGQISDHQLVVQLAQLQKAVLELNAFRTVDNLNSFLRLFCENIRMSNFETQEVDSHFKMNRLRKIIEERWNGEVNIEAISQEINTHPSYAIRCFKKHFGVPPYTFLLYFRINRAIDFLKQGYCPAETAYCCGFTDQSHLTRTMRRLVGLTPGGVLAQKKALLVS